MEYEIGDDPQGLPDKPDGDRDGGLREDRIMFRRGAPAKPVNRHDDAGDENASVEQLGEVA